MENCECLRANLALAALTSAVFESAENDRYILRIFPLQSATPAQDCPGLLFAAQSAMPHISINQTEHSFEAGQTILQALHAQGIAVPTLCHDDRLKPCGDCRMCLVEVAGLAHPVTACNTPLAEGMGCEPGSLTGAVGVEAGRAMFERVWVRSRYGAACLPLRLNVNLQPGELFATFHTTDVFLNQVTSPLRDGQTAAPEYKVTAVQVERA